MELSTTAGIAVIAAIARLRMRLVSTSRQSWAIRRALLAIVGTVGDSERHVVTVEEVELPVVARAFGAWALAEVVVVAADMSEVLAVGGDGEVVEEFGDLSGGLVGELGGHEEVREIRSRSSSGLTMQALLSAAAVRAQWALRLMRRSNPRTLWNSLRDVGGLEQGVRSLRDAGCE